MALAGDLAGIGTGDVDPEFLSDKSPNPINPPMGDRETGLELADGTFDGVTGTCIGGRLLILGLTDGAAGTKLKESSPPNLGEFRSTTSVFRSYELVGLRGIDERRFGITTAPLWYD